MNKLKTLSAEVTNQYLVMLCTETLVHEQGADATIKSINHINEIRALTSIADEEIRHQLRSLPPEKVAPDPDADCP